MDAMEDAADIRAPTEATLKRHLSTGTRPALSSWRSTVASYVRVERPRRGGDFGVESSRRLWPT